MDWWMNGWMVSTNDYKPISMCLTAPTLIGKNNVTIAENAGVVTVCAKLAGNTGGTQVDIPITFTPKVLPPSGTDKAESEFI